MRQPKLPEMYLYPPKNPVDEALQEAHDMIARPPADATLGHMPLLVAAAFAHVMEALLEEKNAG